MIRRVVKHAIKFSFHHRSLVLSLALLWSIGIGGMVQLARPASTVDATPPSIERYLAEAGQASAKQGIHVAEVVRIGSYQPDAQQSFHFYVVRVEGQQSGYVTLAFTLDNASEIVRVE